VDISFTICVFLFVCLFVWLQISPPSIKLAASNFAGRLDIGLACVDIRQSPKTDVLVAVVLWMSCLSLFLLYLLINSLEDGTKLR